MRFMRVLGVVVICLLYAGLSVSAETVKEAFNSAEALTEWQTEGDVSVDLSKNHQAGKGGSLKVGPGGRAELRLREKNGAGKVDFWFYEDGMQREKPKERGSGPLAGVITTGGRVLTVGAVYAPYVSGNKTYCSAEFAPPGEKPWFSLTYLGLKRDVGWHRWTFDFDANDGLSILHNGNEVKRYNWAQSKVEGFAGVVVLGSDHAEKGQTGWIDDVKVELSGEMSISPFEQLVPAEDPAVKGPAPEIVPELAGEHPRLLFSEEDVNEIKAFTKTSRGKAIYKDLLSYLPASKKPDHTKFLRDATDGQRQGMWRLPTVALHYVLTGDGTSFDRTVEFMKFLLDQPHWETGEIDNGMSAANIMIGAALAYDWLYDDLDPDFRELYRKKLWEHARRMYYAGHLKRDPSGHTYWENDPQNNHRWHRNAGLALCALAAYTGEEHQKWLMKQLHDELKFVADWLPPDGTSHESPTYMIFGGSHLILGMLASDRCLGTNHLQEPFFAHVNSFMAHSLTPGLTHRFSFGDMGGIEVGHLGYDVFELKTAGVHNRRDHLAVLNTLLDRNGVGPVSAWLGLVLYPSRLSPGSTSNVATRNFFPDLGLLFIREGWDANAVGAMFKCGPFGGYLLNKFRAETGNYINVAHDDPDANSFIIFDDGEFVAETDRYSKHKQSSNHNTILINGHGQNARSRREGGGWSQPATGNQPMHDMGVITAMARQGRNLAIEGEAAGSYPARRGKDGRPALERYRRTFVWVEGKYILVLDDIRAPEAVDVEWLMQGPEMKAPGGQSHRYVLQSKDASCPFEVAATEDVHAEIVESTADHRGKSLGWKQLRLSVHTQAIRFASVFNPWENDRLSVELRADGPNHARVVVRGKGFEHSWKWSAGQSRFGPSRIVGKNAAGDVIVRMNSREPKTRKLFEEVEKAMQKSK